MKRVLSRIPNVALLLMLLLGTSLASGCGPNVLTLTFTTSPQILDAGIVSDIMTVQLQDAKGMPVSPKTDTVVNLTSTSSTGRFDTTPSGSYKIHITSVTISKGSTSASFYYKDTVAGSQTITAAESPSQGWTAATQTETMNAGALDHFSFSTVGNQTENGAFSVNITAQDVYGNTETSYTESNTLSDTTGTINPTTTGAFAGGIWTDNIIIASVQSGITITTFGGGMSGVSNAFDIVAGVAGTGTKLAFTTAPQTITAGNMSEIIALQTQDTSSNPYNVTEDRIINLASSSASGTFYSDTAGLNPIAMVTINAGVSSASFYYKDTVAGSPAITAAESPSQGWTAATQTETMNAGALDHFSFSTVGNQTENGAFSVDITAQDVYGNTVTSYTESNTLSDTTGTVSPNTTGAFTGGIWTDNITIALVQSGVTITTFGGGMSGVSNAFDIIAGAAGTGAKLAFTTASQTITAGNVSEIITLQTQDTSSNPYNVTEDRNINLTSSSASGTFYSDAAGLNPIAMVTINAGASSASFYYKDTVAGSLVITAVESPSQGWTAATQYETINLVVPPADTASKIGVPLFLVIIVGASGLILGLVVGYLIALRIKRPADRKKREMEMENRLISTVAEKKAELTDAAKQEQVPEVMQKTAETAGVTKQEQVLEVIQKTAGMADATRQEPTSDLLQEIETNFRIATTPAKDSLVAFQTRVWDSKRDEVSSLPASIKEELSMAYSTMSSANGIVWLATEMGRRSPNLDDNYTKLCKGIADQLNKVRQSWPVK